MGQKQGPLSVLLLPRRGACVWVRPVHCKCPRTPAHAQLAVCGPFPRCRPLSFQVDGRQAGPAIRCEQGTRTGGRSGLHTRGCAACPLGSCLEEKEAAETLPPLRTWDRLSSSSGGANDRAAVWQETGVAGFWLSSFCLGMSPAPTDHPPLPFSCHAASVRM